MRSMEVDARRRLLRRRDNLLRILHGDRYTGPFEEEGECPHEHRFAAAAATGRLSEREQRELLEIEHALDRMRQGQYGACTVCGQPIGRLRLLAIPEARSCSACGERDEMPLPAAQRAR